MNGFFRCQPSCEWLASGWCSILEIFSVLFRVDVDGVWAKLLWPLTLLRRAKVRCWSCFRLQDLRFVPGSLLPCQAWLYQSTGDSSVQTVNAVKVSRRAVLTNDFLLPQHPPQTSPNVLFPSTRSHLHLWPVPPSPKTVDGTRALADWLHPHHKRLHRE